MGCYVVGMETSGAVRNALIALGHEAISVDLLPSQNGGPHHQGDLFDFIDANPGRFDGGVFHPECTFHTLSAAWAFKDADFDRYPEVGYHQRVKAETLTGEARRAARTEAERDVERIWRLPFVTLIENPRGTLTTRTAIGKPSDVLQPYEFGADASKDTCIWAHDANGQLIPGAVFKRDPADWVKPRMWCPNCKQCSRYDAAFGQGCPHCGGEAGALRPRWANQTDTGQNRLSPDDKRWQVRSDTYPGIAAALASKLVELTAGYAPWSLFD